jgi:chemotaxis protein MotB
MDLQGENARLQSDLVEAERKLAEKPKVVTVEKTADFGPGVEVAETARQITVTLPNAILFDSGQAVLKASSKTTLGNVAAVIKRDYASKMVRVEGHTDSDPIRKSKWKDNWELSCQRGLAVLRYLVAQGIPKTQVYAAGFGQHTPRDTNATKAGKARNRRVQVVIIK